MFPQSQHESFLQSGTYDEKRLFQHVNMATTLIKYITLMKAARHVGLREKLNMQTEAATTDSHRINFERLLSVDEPVLFASRLFYAATVVQSLVHCKRLFRKGGQPAQSRLPNANFVANLVSAAEQIALIRRLCLPFLRTMALFFRCLGYATPYPSNTTPATTLEERQQQGFLRELTRA